MWERIRLTMSENADDDDGLQTGFFLVGPRWSATCPVSRCAGIPHLRLAISLVRVEDTSDGRDYAQTDPHFLFLFMADELIFQSPQGGYLSSR